MHAPQRSLKARALQWLALREHSRAELRRKLLPWAVPPADGTDTELEPAAVQVERLLDWLSANRFLCEDRFREARVHARSARFGNLRIRQELKTHELELGAEMAQALAASELQRACAVRAKKFPTGPADLAGRARQARFLAGRGFSPEVIQRALRLAAGSNLDADDPDPCPE